MLQKQRSREFTNLLNTKANGILWYVRIARLLLRKGDGFIGESWKLVMDFALVKADSRAVYYAFDLN